jgi:hypothetical protein
MPSIELDGPDAAACPLLGLAADPRSHFTYPHPDHRCFAAKGLPTADASRQAIYCLSPGFSTCDRYQAWSGTRGSSRPSTARPAAGR